MANKNLNKFKRKIIISIFVFLVLVIAVYYFFGLPGAGATPIEEQYKLLPTETAKKLFYVQSESLTKEVDPRLIELNKLTIGCFGPSRVMGMDDSAVNLGGQCCGVLKSTHMYEEQLETLQKYNRIPQIPKDPYNMPVKLVKKLIEYDNDIKLNAEQQKIFDKASEMSNEKGPCCCKCWKWYAYSGLAKYLIVEHNFNAEQITEVFDISDSCGEHGEHHSGVLKHDKHEE